MKDRLKAYIDLTRLHFFFVWPILFSSGLFLGFQIYNGFSWQLVLSTALIGFVGFEAGFILNDYVDRDLDQHDVESDKMTAYWRVFGTKPISMGLISSRAALTLFLLLVLITLGLTSALAFPHSIYVLVIMIYSYCLEYFYQVKKRSQSVPIAQLLGRTDFTLFPIAGYLCIGHPDINTLLFALFFYPLAMAHLGVNDLIDVANDRIKKLKTIPVLYGLRKTTYWIVIFSVIHIITAILFLTVLGVVSQIGFAIGFLLISTANYRLLKSPHARSGMKALPIFHVSMLTYAISIILDFFI
jgi:4-hydroxybenzoate polyprenyltransferase